MKIETLFTEQIQEAFKQQGYTGDKSMAEIKVVCKLFNPCGVGTWWLYEHVEGDIYMAFCLLGNSQDAEIGAISLNELLSLKLPFGLSIERDIHFTPFEKTLREIYDQVKNH